MSVLTRANVKLDNGNMDMPNELGSFYINFITFSINIQRGQYITVKLILQTKYHQVILIFYASFKNVTV